MTLIVGRHGFLFRGGIDEFRSLLADYPPHTTLAEFLQLNLH